MMDITKEEFWENKCEEVNTKNKGKNKLAETIKNHKIITVLLIALSAFIIANTVLIYNFFRILLNI